MTTLTQPTPDEIVAEARALLNRKVDELQWNNGIYERSDRSIKDAVAAIQALTKKRLPSVEVLGPNARDLIQRTHWHEPSWLSKYLDSKSEEYQRDLFQCGVYTLFELVDNKHLKPLFIEAFPRYVGMSGVLSQRLREHASGGFGSNPADHVMQEYLLANATDAERAAYAVASHADQREFRKLAMANRGLCVRTTHTKSRTAAYRLEDVMTHLYRSQGYKLWNVNPKPRAFID